MAKLNNDSQQEIDSIEVQLRLGNLAEAQARLGLIRKSELTEPQTLQMANIARRANRPQLTLQLLKSYVRPRIPNSKPAPAKHKAEYAMGLQRIGAVNEAMSLLREIDAIEFPLVDLYKMFCAFSVWNYEDGLIAGERYLAAGKFESTYQQLIARVNQAAALTAMGRIPEAQNSLDDLRTELNKDKHALLLTNTLEISAQLAILQHDFKSARKFLNNADQLISKNSFQDRLFVDKWFSILNALEKKDRSILQNFRKHAIELGHWETLRDLDYFQLQIEPNLTLAHWLFFGTPYSFYRRRLLSNLPQFFNFSSEKVTASLKPNPKYSLSLFSIESDIGDIAHRTAVYLASDFYRPFRVGELFSALFPESFFDPDSSVNRIQQTIHRAREFFSENKWPARILEKDGAYSFRLNENTGLQCYSTPPKAPTGFSREKIVTAFLAHKINSPDFSNSQAASALKLSSDQSRRLLNDAVVAGCLEKLGAGKTTTYVFKI